ncbi:uncharacterized protein LOC114916720 [Cajanus cajan]|uniref:uncharacterized protein LOC114916720 n=1 Tax=Cajanus cajan TaxID=3821 RepID=UPI0010FB2E90|nr:uncharacterized protein LOC114916720 [Cajanus cajan]
MTESPPEETQSLSEKIDRRRFVGEEDRSVEDRLNSIPKPCWKGDSLAIKIPEDAYREGLARCSTHLHGRVLLAKGQQPLKVDELKARLSKVWKHIAGWNIIPLGRGFFELEFQRSHDLEVVLAAGSLNLDPGWLRLSLWKPDFNPRCYKNTFAQVWLRILELPQEYWSPRIILAIASAVGTPISLDKATLDRKYGHFARVLIEIDLAHKIPTQLLVEREGYAFFVSFEFDRLPPFCTICKCIGHVDSACNVVIHAGDGSRNSNMQKGHDRPRKFVDTAVEEGSDHVKDNPHADQHGDPDALRTKKRQLAGGSAAVPATDLVHSGAVGSLEDAPGTSVAGAGHAPPEVAAAPLGATLMAAHVNADLDVNSGAARGVNFAIMDSNSAAADDPQVIKAHGAASADLDVNSGAARGPNVDIMDSNSTADDPQVIKGVAGGMAGSAEHIV